MEYLSFIEENNRIHTQILKSLREFTQDNQDVQGQMVIIFPSGVPIASSWQGTVDPILIGAISAAVKLTFQHLCNKLKRGKLKRLYVKSDYGKLIIQNSGPHSILTTIMNFHANVLEIAFRITNIAEKVEKLMRKYKDE